MPIPDADRLTATGAHDPPSRRVGEHLYDNDRLPTAGHIFVPRSLDAGPDSVVAVGLYANKSGLYFESLLLSLANMGLFFAFNVWLSTDYDTKVGNTNDFAAALVLLFPALAITIVTQRDDHRIASRAYAWTRLFLFAQALAAAIGALVFALQLDEQAGRRVWNLALFLAIAAATRTVISSTVHAWRISVTRDRLLVWKRGFERISREYRAVRDVSSPEPKRTG